MKKLVFSFALLLTGLVLGSQQQSTAQAELPPAEELDPSVGPGGPDKWYHPVLTLGICFPTAVNCLPTYTIRDKRIH